MDRLQVILRSGQIEESRSWRLTSTGALASIEGWEPERIPERVRVNLDNSSTGPGSWTLHLTSEGLWNEDVTAEVHIGLEPREAPEYILWPRYYGVFERFRCEEGLGAEFRGPASPTLNLPDEERLALPMAVLESTEGVRLAGTDPELSTSITIRRSDDGQAWLVFSWRWLATAGVHTDETRRLFISPAHDVRTALDKWFDLATPEVPKAPEWLHEVALQDYDYLSKDGKGWYADIDAACEMIAPDDRHRALFCLHGWYDQFGHYCYDADTGRLDEDWVVFPYINRPELLERAINNPARAGNPYSFRNLDLYHPVPISWQSMRDRLRYARDRGLRTAVYALGGLLASGEREPHVADGTGLDIVNLPWQGPDLIGESYVMNPLHPGVRNWITRYIQALLERVGDLTDVLVMDEAHYVGSGALGPRACPGYADRGQLCLVREIAALCHDYRPELAFLTHDGLGASWRGHRAFPYSLYADGVYQDSACWPPMWDCTRFPTWRNIAWSCNWAPVTHLAWTRWSVLAYNAPVAVSNGCFGDDTGLSDMGPETAQQIADLWRMRVGREFEKPVIVKTARG